MGYPRDFFLADDEIDDNLVCPICQDVLKDPQTLVDCGHSFCRPCLEECREESCPTCRGGQGEMIPSFALRGLVGNLQIRCFNNNSHPDENSNAAPGPSTRSRQRRRIGERGESQQAVDTTPPSCSWTGKLFEWESHAKTSCAIPTSVCQVHGCDFRGNEAQLEAHALTNATKHIQLMKDDFEQRFSALKSQVGQVIEEKKDIETEIDALKSEFKRVVEENQDIKSDMADLREGQRRLTTMAAKEGLLLSFHQQWLLRKPEPLHEYVVYCEKLWHPMHKNPEQRLLCGIPGPKRTPWEGGLFPALMTWNVNQLLPPTCKFPKGFTHVNVYPSGTISLSTVNEEKGWSTDIQITEILFVIQQLLAHANEDAPAQAKAYKLFTNDRPAYDRVVREQSNHYTPDNFLGEACRAFELEQYRWELLENDCKFVNFGSRQNPPIEPPPPNEQQRDALREARPNVPEGCECSCCAWAVSQNCDLRFLFGA